jgi:hypothetical protein
MNTQSVQHPDQSRVKGDRDGRCLEAFEAESLMHACGTTTYLVRKGAGSEITKRKLESAVATLDVDLESDQGVLISCRSRRHDCYDQGCGVSANKLSGDVQWVSQVGKTNCCVLSTGNLRGIEEPGR